MRTATSLSWPAGQQMKKEVEQTSCAGRRRRVGKAWRISINATPNARASTATFKTMSSISTRYPLRSRGLAPAPPPPPPPPVATRNIEYTRPRSFQAAFSTRQETQLLLVTSSFSTTEISTWQKRSTEVKSWLRSLERALSWMEDVLDGFGQRMTQSLTSGQPGAVDGILKVLQKISNTEKIEMVEEETHYSRDSRK
ncbi:hypothetical protein T310_0933 [Rasamsonia emersonii CBS 393.64]|uniref:Uncharacterized protein n=1 Tax=Rasamsonia emersonii (strain ATCC 16479 / CBS 393.64 / IMI 116815) TaxID=1408163 RepID=A0A0F4Z5A0_RASE3|nr:hypothetical protein T310_0933 [Rasamsonia emersonii CBS 393.64]KKA25068.1 hypothetical protein T310_0933 [Rasamsonia emersonii CBS 393.64]